MADGAPGSAGVSQHIQEVVMREAQARLQEAAAASASGMDWAAWGAGGGGAWWSGGEKSYHGMEHAFHVAPFRPVPGPSGEPWVQANCIIPTDRLGLIIGKQGSTFKSLNELTKATMVIPDAPHKPPFRDVIITGRPEFVEFAVDVVGSIVRGTKSVTVALKMTPPAVIARAMSEWEKTVNKKKAKKRQSEAEAATPFKKAREASAPTPSSSGFVPVPLDASGDQGSTIPPETAPPQSSASTSAAAPPPLVPSAAHHGESYGGSRDSRPQQRSSPPPIPSSALRTEPVSPDASPDSRQHQAPPSHSHPSPSSHQRNHDQHSSQHSPHMRGDRRTLSQDQGSHPMHRSSTGYAAPRPRPPSPEMHHSRRGAPPPLLQGDSIQRDGGARDGAYGDRGGANGGDQPMQPRRPPPDNPPQSRSPAATSIPPEQAKGPENGAPVALSEARRATTAAAGARQQQPDAAVDSNHPPLPKIEDISIFTKHASPVVIGARDTLTEQHKREILHGDAWLQNPSDDPIFEKMRCSALEALGQVLERLETGHQQESAVLSAAAKILGSGDRHLQEMLEISLQDKLQIIRERWGKWLISQSLEIYRTFQDWRREYVHYLSKKASAEAANAR